MHGGSLVVMMQAQEAQQQIAALLATAAPQSEQGQGQDDAGRVLALQQLQQLVVQPAAVAALRRLLQRVCQQLHQLVVGDRAPAVRQAAAAAHGAAAAMAVAAGQPVHAERFLGWATPLVAEGAGDGEAAGLAVTGLREFLQAGDAGAVERYAGAVCKACQAVVEDESAPMAVVRPLLKLLPVLARKFRNVFEPHFADMVDLLLGWALEAGLGEADREMVMETFLGFQDLWVGRMGFTLGLLGKFLDDVQMLAQENVGSGGQMRRLLGLVECFGAVLRATVSGVVEAECEGEVAGLCREVGLLGRFLGLLGVVGRRYGDYGWVLEGFKCLVMFGELLRGEFGEYYGEVVDVLLESLGVEGRPGSLQHGCVVGLGTTGVTSRCLTSQQVHGLLQLNVELLSLQGSGLSGVAVGKLVEFGSSFSNLRLHPNRVVTGTVSATYLLLLQRGSPAVGEVGRCLVDEMVVLKGFLEQSCVTGGRTRWDGQKEGGAVGDGKGLLLLSDAECVALFRFDLMALVGSVCLAMESGKMALGLKKEGSYSGSDLQSQDVNVLLRLKDLRKFIWEKLNPFSNPLQCYPDLQLAIVRALHRLDRARVWNKQQTPPEDNSQLKEVPSAEGAKHELALEDERLCLFESSHIIAQGLSASASLSVKLEVLNWINSLCEVVFVCEQAANKAMDSVAMKRGICKDFAGRGVKSAAAAADSSHVTIGQIVPANLLWMLLAAASDKEQKVRERVAAVLDMLLQAEVIDASQVHAVAIVALEQLGDSEPALQIAYRRVLLAYGPAALWTDDGKAGAVGASRSGFFVFNDRKPQHWKALFSLKPFSQHLRTQQLVCILNYVAQRWQVFPSQWVQRLVHTSPSYVKAGATAPVKALGEENVPQLDAAGSESSAEAVGALVAGDLDFLAKACSSNNLAALWWCIQEAARHCVAVRLRTHLGGPTQTFAAVERMLLEVAQLLQADGQREVVGLGSTSSVRLLPMRLLLEFVEALKKNVYNAFDGSLVLPAAPSASALFFRANKKVCEEWFSRIREALMNASIAIQCHSGTVHQATWRLQDLRAMSASVLREQPPRSQMSDSMKFKVQQDVGRVLRNASLALCRAHDADALVGLQVWASSTFGSLFIDDGLVLQRASSPVGPFGWMHGLAFQARGQYEQAAAHFAHLLQSEEALGAMGADGVQFTIARTIESYVAIADWESLDSWLQTLQMLRARHAGKAYSGALTTAGNDMNSIHALARYDAGDSLGAWGYLDLTPQSSNELTADPRLALQRSEQMLLQAMMHSDNKREDAFKEILTSRAMLEEALLVAGMDGLSEAAPFIVQLESVRVFEEGKGQSSISVGQRVKRAVLSAMPNVISSPYEIQHQDCSLWLKLLRVYRATNPSSQLTLQLQQQLVKLARKQHNFKLAHRLLPSSLVQEVLNARALTDAGWESLKLSFEFESILLLFAEDKQDEAVERLWNFVQGDLARCSLGPPSEALDGNKSFIKAKACLKLSSWLSRKKHHLSPSLLLKMTLDTSGSFGCKEENLAQVRGELNCPSSLEEVVGAAMKVATAICPGRAKAWFSYACWCYEHAKGYFSGAALMPKPTAFLQLLESEVNGSDSSLTEREVANIRHIIVTAAGGQGSSVLLISKLESIDEGKASYVESLVQRIVFVMQAAAGAAGVEDSEGDSPATLLSFQLQQELRVLQLNSSHCISIVSQLMTIWWALRRRRVILFGHAARGFLQYLSMSNYQQKTRTQASVFDRGKAERKDTSLLASLYVLRILLNYGVELEDSLQQGLSMVPPSPWQAITPQLLARLSSHPEPRVRKQLQGLLIALANVSPWAIVYPTLVDYNACEGSPSDELQHLLGCLENLHPKLVGDVQVMIAELGSITVLWEEQWLSTLQDLHSDVARRINTLKEEATRVAENPTLSHTEKVRINAAKYSAMMAPIAVALERRLASTSRTPATPHEVWFQEHFGGQLKAAISAFKLPPSGSASLGDAWRPLDMIAASLANYQKKSATVLADVSPLLAALKSSEAPMPGLEVGISNHHAEIGGGVKGPTLAETVTVAALDEQVFILSTKTKPKKLSLVGSDGQRYRYLLKGREDLRLDARIMQLLHAVNGMLSASSHTRRQGLSVRYYSVTPISGRAGLIQWVDNLTSMYSVYKAWQQRTQAAQLAANPAGTNGSAGPPAIPRPSDMFYGKIIPALKEKGLRKVISRRDWPQEVKRKVLLELMKETPRQVLYRELWCASEGITAFSSKLQRFSGSVAVMSMVGHVLGLGDRHLDNILVDFSTGDVIHIDYNVCFDKGLRLKIPEIVPFRLTQTIQAALGLTGVEGTFRASCEAVLEALQRNKELILMLLEVFVWDPLVEWMRGDGHDEATIGGEERKGMELAVSLSLFASRVQEIRVPLQEHHDQLLATLPAAVDSLQALAEASEHFERATAGSMQTEQIKSSAAKNEAAARAVMNDASSVLDKARMTFESQAREFTLAKGLVSEAAKEFTQWIEHHGRVLESLRGGSVSEMQAIGQLPSPVEALSLTAAVLAAGVPLTVVPEPAQVHCKEVDREVAQLTAARHEYLLHAARALGAYSVALQRLLPLNYVGTSHVHTWAQILQRSVRQLSPDVLTVAKRQAADLVGRCSGEHDEAARHKYEAVRRRVEKLVEESKMLQEAHAELERSIDPDAERKAKDRLVGIFTRHLQGGSHLMKKEDDSVGLSGNQGKLVEELKDKDLESEDKKLKLIVVLQAAAGTMYTEIADTVSDLCNTSESAVKFENNQERGNDQKWCLPILQNLTERCVLVSEILDEIQRSITNDTGNRSSSAWSSADPTSTEWALRCRECIVGVKDLVSQMVAVVLPEAIKAALSNDPAVLEAFGALSEIRGTVDSALEQVAEIERQRSSLGELERSYPVKFGEISQQLASLEEAAMSGRDHLSWEEAEELASQEEACRAMQDKLHRAWAQRGAQANSLSRQEAEVQSTLISAEQRFDSLVEIDRDADLHLMRGKVLLAAFARLFSGLASVDQALGVYKHEALQHRTHGGQLDLMRGYTLESVWKASTILQDKTFFVWKVRMMDALLEACIQDALPLADVGLTNDQLLSHQKKRHEEQLQGYLDQYLKARVSVVLLECLINGRQLMRPSTSAEEDEVHVIRKEAEPVKRALRLLREYCDIHETVSASKAAAASMKLQLEDVTQRLQKAQLEAAQLEWLHEAALSRSIPQSQLLGMPSSVAADADLPNVSWWSRQQVMGNLRSSIAKITQATEGLLACDVPGSSAEEQLDRAMAWACAGSSTSTSSGSTSVRNVGIPPEFHEHLRRRRQLLWSGQEQASGIVRLCEAVVNFEESREGYLLTTPASSNVDEKTDWQQTCQNLLCRLENVCLSFTRSDLECQASQKSREVAAALLTTAMQDYSRAATEATIATLELRHANEELQEHIVHSAAAVSGFCQLLRHHSALTVESGTMLEEVLAITDGAAGATEVHSLAQEASAEHSRMMADLNKVSGLLLPVEPLLAACCTAITNHKRVGDAEKKADSLNLSSVQSFHLRDVLPSCMGTVPGLLDSVRRLHSTLTKLARTASSDAGVLHKALEGVGESQGVRSQDVEAPGGLTDPEVLFPNDQGDATVEPLMELRAMHGESVLEEDLLLDDDEDNWISPPGSDQTSESAYLSNRTALDNISQNMKATGAPLASTAAENQDGVEGRPGIQLKVQRTASPAAYSNVNSSASLPSPQVEPQKEKNAYAVSVLRRVRTKLEGRDIDGSRHLPVSEQVDHLLRQATSIDNLCNMFEGWTPWI